MSFRKALKNGSGNKQKLGYMAMISAVLVLALVICCAPVKSSTAYFTAVTSATGGVEINYSESDDFHEDVDGLEKTLTVKNNSTMTVFARIKAMAPQSVGLSYSGENWSDGGDGYWYYNLPLGRGQTTGELTVKIIPGDYNDEFEVVVAEELTMARYKPDGTAYANWKGTKK